MGDMEMNVDLAVIGAGPGGFSAAFRGADLGLDVALIDPHPTPGGNYLYTGCIPAMALLHIAATISDAGTLSQLGVDFGEPTINQARVMGWKDEVVEKIGQHLAARAKHRGIQLIKGYGRFENEKRLQIESGDINHISFGSCVIGAGSHPAPLAGVDYSSGRRIINHTDALNFHEVPDSILIIGGSSTGLETGVVYSALGSNVFLAAEELRLLPHIDADLALPLQNRLTDIFSELYLETKITRLTESETGVETEMITGREKRTKHFNQVIIATGSLPAGNSLCLEKAGVLMDEGGRIFTDEQQRTNVNTIFAVGNAAGCPVMAHTAMRQGRVAAEVIAGSRTAFDVRADPQVLFTDPQIAWCGLTEREAKKQGIPVTVRTFDWKDSYRAQTIAAAEGITKLLADPETGRLLGVGICGRNAESLIAEGATAIEMSCLAEDLALTLHPHPTLSESLGNAAEVFMGTSIFTDISPEERKPTNKL